jgi:hypothetical protein
MRYCKICSNQSLRKIVDNLRGNGLSYREIQDYLLTKFNIKISLWSLSNHFWHIQPHSNIPKLEEDEIILDKTTLDKVCNSFMTTFRKHIQNPSEVEKFLNYLNDYMESEPQLRLETNKTVYEDIKKIISHSPLEDSLKANMLKEFTSLYSQIISKQEANY